jgi:hypothetical protein
MMLNGYPESLMIHKRLAHALREAAGPSTIIAVEDAGTLPYYSGLATIDYVGLASREITDYLHDRAEAPLPAPDVILLYTARADACEPITRFTGIHAVLDPFVKDDRYACVQGIQVGQAMFMNALVRRDAPQAQALADAVRGRAFDTPRAALLSRRDVVMQSLRFDALKEDFRD